MHFAAGAGLPAFQAISTIKAPSVPSSIQRRHSASSDIVEAALQEQFALVNSNKREYHCRPTATARRTLQGCHAIMTPCSFAGAALSQQKHQSNSASRQALSDKEAAQSFLPLLQAATHRTGSTNMLGCHVATFATHDTSFCAQHCTASAARSIYRQRNSHLAALKAQGDLDSVSKSAAFEHTWPAQRRLDLALNKAIAGAGQAEPSQKNKPVRDMFGVAAGNDSSTGVDVGLVLMRPASSLW